MDLFNVICGVCSVVGLLVCLFTAGKVIKISQIINHGNQDDVINKFSFLLTKDIFFAKVVKDKRRRQYVW